MDDPFSFCIFAAVLRYQPTRNEINMTKSVEELKMILDIATNGGKMEAQNEMLLEKVARMEKDMKRLENENKKLKNDLTEKTKECEELEAKIMCDMKMDEQDSNNQGSIVFVNNITMYYLGPRPWNTWGHSTLTVVSAQVISFTIHCRTAYLSSLLRRLTS